MTDTTATTSTLPEAVAVEQPGARRYARSPRIPHLTPEERAARGKAARADVPRSSHAVFEPSPTRADPVALLERQAATRVPDLVPIRHGRMLASEFAFFRGAALIMAEDLSSTPRSGLLTQLCGDAHLSNFGMFASPERRMVFDINDFDETLPGPWEWDVKRLAASFVIAGRDREFTQQEISIAVLEAVSSYRTAMQQFAAQPNLTVWYARLDIEDLMASIKAEAVNTRGVKMTEEVIAKARTRDSMRAFSKLTEVVDGQRRILSDPPLIVPVADLYPDMERDEVIEQLRSLLRSYQRTLTNERRSLFQQFHFVDLARKVVGVGSVGTRAWVAFFTGRDSDDPLFLQVKEAPPSVLESYLGPSEYSNCGQRVVSGQRLMQSVSDLMLGWQRVKGVDGVERDYYVRQLYDGKGSIPIERLLPRGLAIYGKVCGWTLARAHARTGDRIAIAAYLGTGSTFDRAICDFAFAYAEQNAKDYAALKAAVDSGRVQAVMGL
ncbi:MAG TPA: DUF2252 domain-containing protein [Actinomycetes bacterium]|nr:DUF2252 domain-containing protein [Actinomycetes bacterium]